VIAYEYSGGPIRQDRALYVERSADQVFQQAIQQKRDVFIITAPRQTGKTSLWYKVVRQLETQGFKTGLIDFRVTLGQPDEKTRSAKGWTETLLRAVARCFDPDVTELQGWITANSDRSTTELIVRFFREFLRPRVKGPVVVVFDEIDMVQLYHWFTDNLFEAVRALAADRDELDMSFVIIGLNHPKDLLKTAPSGGFNISGLHIALDDFDSEDEATVEAWARGYPAPAHADALAIARTILRATGGQPYLTAYLFEQARKNGVTDSSDVASLVDTLIEDARNGKGIAVHFDSPRDIIKERPNLAFRMIDVVDQARKNPVSTMNLRGDVRAALVSTGLVRERNRSFVMKSPIYKEFFDSEWISDLRKSIGSETTTVQRRFVAGQPDKKRVCIINTGGMISMELQPDGKIDAPHDLTAYFRTFPELLEIADFAAVPLMFKDSSDMNPDDWARVAQAIYDRRDDGFSGFVVVHGTDTLPHTASAVAYALGEGLSFPVVFVGSQTAPHVIHGDARINLMRACTLATRSDIPEVVAVINDRIHRAVRVEKRDDFRFDGMHSPTFEPLGLIADRIEIKAGIVRKPPRIPEINLRNEFSHNVFKIALYPGLDPGFLMPVLDNAKLEGVIIETLGIGNIPVEGKWSLVPFIEKAAAANIPVLLVSQFPIQPEMTAKYQPASAPLVAGAIGAANMAPPAAVTKFMWVLPQVKRRVEAGATRVDKRDEVIKWMNLDFVGEVGSSPAN
jgi:L-asparaginase/Glu-tRNA(Gln) amidotransferase subunit D